MNKTLNFSIEIQAPRDRVWQAMLFSPTYDQWTSAFCEGSRYEGGWNPGDRIRFLTPSGEGMVSEVVENRRGEFVSIRHLGEIRDGTEDTTSERVRAWAPAYENYTYIDSGQGTLVRVDVDVVGEYEQFMLDTFPKALQSLKAICESAST